MLYVKMCVKITFGWYSRFFVVFGCIGVVLIVFAWFYVSLCVYVWFSLFIPVFWLVLFGFMVIYRIFKVFGCRFVFGKPKAGSKILRKSPNVSVGRFLFHKV